MWLLVDYENVRCSGLTGVEWLGPQDSLVLFYSDACEVMRRGVMDTIDQSGCWFETVKLDKPGKNALDFYITSYLAELAAGGECDELALITRDNGFNAVICYWKQRRPRLKIHKAWDVLNALAVESAPDMVRSVKIKRSMDQIHIGTEAERISRKNWYREELSIRLDPDTDIDIWALAEELQNCSPGRETYLSLMHRFGIPDGLIIYQAVKALNSVEKLKAG